MCLLGLRCVYLADATLPAAPFTFTFSVVPSAFATFTVYRTLSPERSVSASTALPPDRDSAVVIALFREVGAFCRSVGLIRVNTFSKGSLEALVILPVAVLTR